MCGIVAYLGDKNGIDVVINGLKRLEYRGYDSSGISFYDNKIHTLKRKGEVSVLSDLVNELNIKGKTAIGHTRWATHGEPSNTNAHPHNSPNNKITVVHNGIIENYFELKSTLIKNGYKFKSETDTEIIPILIQELQQQGYSFLDALKELKNHLIGAYALVIMTEEFPNQLFGLKKGSPMVLGIGKNEFLLASDPSPIIEHTKQVIYINDDEIVVLSKNNFEIIQLEDKQRNPIIETLDLEVEMIEKNGYDHFMLKEIFEQPKTIYDSLRGRISSDYQIKLGGIDKFAPHLFNANRLIIIGCGTSYYAGFTAQYFLEFLTRIPTQIEFASEFRYKNPIISSGDAIIAISQSGETADTKVAIEEAKIKGASIFGVCNVVGSSIARMAHEGAYTHAGIEIGVASTKAFTAQLSVLFLIAIKIAQMRKTYEQSKLDELTKELSNINKKVDLILKQTENIQNISKELAKAKSILFLGRGIQYPIAMEGALKMKEITYIHSEGFASGEMKHGPIALIESNTPTIIICLKDENYLKNLSNIKEIKSRKGKVIGIITQGDNRTKELLDFCIEIPNALSLIAPILSVIPLQLLSYYTARELGNNIDKPRNLAKSVTVE